MDILIGYDGKIDRTFIEHCINLKWIGWFATGVNNLPLNYIKERDIILTNGKGIQAKQVSEYIMTFILHDYKKMKTSYRNQLEKIMTQITGKRLNRRDFIILGNWCDCTKGLLFSQSFWNESNRG